MCVTIRSLPFMTGAKPISLSGFNRRVRIGSHRKNLIFAPCAAAMGFLLAHSAAFVLYCKKQQGCLVQFCCCNLSPRGDGNTASAGARLRVHIATYPREGTETCRACREFLSKRLQLIPARGRKRFIVLSSLYQIRCNLSPRGDGNSQDDSS